MYSCHVFFIVCKRNAMILHPRVTSQPNYFIKYFLFSPWPQAGLGQVFCEFPGVFPNTGPVSNPQEVGFQREQAVGGSAIPLTRYQGPDGPCFSQHRAEPAEPVCLLNTRKTFRITEIRWRDCYSAN